MGFLMADPRFGLAGDPLLAKLRQYNVGWLPTGHFGTVTPQFLYRYVVPMFPPRSRADLELIFSPSTRRFQSVITARGEARIRNPCFAAAGS